LDIEIEANPNTEYILEIIKKARKHRRTQVEIRTPFDGIFRVFDDIVRTIVSK